MTCHQCGGEGENPESGLCSACEAESRQKINGLLYLPALGLISSLLYGIINLFYISRLVLASYHLTGQLTLYTLFLPVALAVDVGVTLYAMSRFFRRRSNTKYVMVIYYAIGALYAFYLVGIPALLYDAPLSGIKLRICGSALCGLVIWTPYFLRSRRVARVFTR